MKRPWSEFREDGIGPEISEAAAELAEKTYNQVIEVILSRPLLREAFDEGYLDDVLFSFGTDVKTKWRDRANAKADARVVVRYCETRAPRPSRKSEAWLKRQLSTLDTNEEGN